MLKLFQKPTIEKVEEPDKKKQELATVQVKDIKQYLVDEYERSQKLLDRNEYLRQELEGAKELQLKYDATLVTLDAYQQRLEKQERLLEGRDREIEKLQKKLEGVREELNTCKIQLTRAALTRDEIKNEVAAETKKQIIQDIQEQKGSLSKMRVVEIIQRSVAKEEATP